MEGLLAKPEALPLLCFGLIGMAFLGRAISRGFKSLSKKDGSRTLYSGPPGVDLQKYHQQNKK